MKKLLIIFGLLISTIVSAEVSSQLDVSKLTQEQRAAIQLQITQIAERKADSSNLAVTVREEASKWADLGKNVGTALVASAKEVGQGVNEFSQTQVGQITTAIIVYKVIGRDVIKLVVGFMTLVVGTLISFYVFRNAGADFTYENISRLNGLWVSKKMTKKSRSEDWHIASMTVSLIILVLTWSIGLNVIF